MLDSFLYKRISFAHERELRAIILKPINGGVLVPIHLGEMIETIRVSPTSPTWFKDIVERLVKTLGVNIPVKQSSLSAGPLF
jgi:hypothetical protein